VPGKLKKAVPPEPLNRIGSEGAGGVMTAEPIAEPHISLFSCHEK
jgi:hypothetical protein